MKTMPDGWEPRKAGRPPLVNAVPVLRSAQKKPDEWVSFATYSEKEVKSLKRQLIALGCEVSIGMSDGAKKTPMIYVKWSTDE